VTVYPDWDFIKDAAEQYMAANPGTTITLEAIAGSSDDYFANLPRILGTDEAADVTVVSTGRGGWADLVATGNLADVSSVWERKGLEDVLLGPVVESYTEADGRHLSVNVGLNWIPVIYYNKTMFADLGIEAPDAGRIASDADWLAITDALAAADVIPFALNTIFGGRYLWMQLAISNCGTQWMLDLMDSASPGGPAAAKYTDSCNVEVLETLSGWNDRGIFGDSPATVDRDIAESLLFSEQAGMYVSGSWETGPITAAELPFDVGWFLLPSMAAEPTGFGLETYDSLAIAGNSDNKELAEDFMAYVADAPFQTHMVQYARFSSRTDLDYDESTIPELALSQYALLGEYGGVAAPNVKIHPRIKSALNEGWVEILVGTTTAAQLAEDVEALAEEIRAG
jgi:raffinose/stachyose/melibiose transport system substrate-binding protein